MNDLLALAVVRRPLRELGRGLGPEPPGMLVGPLGQWIHERRPGLQGRSPLNVLGELEGEGLVRDCLKRMLRLD